MKPLHAEWITDFYNHMTTPESKKIMESRWLSSGVSDAIRLGSNKLSSIDPFDNIAPMTDAKSFTISLCSSAFALSNEEKSVGYSREETPDDEDNKEDDEHLDEASLDKILKVGSLQNSHGTLLLRIFF